jgi:hypothetical protein
VGGYVKIDLYKQGYFMGTIIASTSNTGSYTWYTASNLSTNTQYQIKITSVSSSSIYAYSDYFTINSINGFFDVEGKSTQTWKIFDDDIEDGDIIRVSIDGVVKIPSLTITKAGATYTVTFSIGMHTIEIYSISQGYSPPTTASITMDDGDGAVTIPFHISEGETGYFNMFIK